MKQWYSASELVGMPGMPLYRENVARKARVENWQFRQCSVRKLACRLSFEKYILKIKLVY
ncbi:MAG: hypothetical protein CLLPBCKN_001637 [Chroococcidiopsis cubana SAG 39.79]|uniref:HTH Mu-type domain-containing protein n=1 Tax=Chroococcidiopsis cubana SAG 39.79 TaxID=388085 RepID=A0AB37UEG0_9CYAN|nr:hypothetical protein [Chroococcidiopsis cubana SAG 39.79]RUT07394.1 hypothetical protein DSM107010_50730 [Chroococcidiopsis cubana SAG 39.79]